MARRGGHWCCECDYCGAETPCDKTPPYSVFLSDYGEATKNYDYYLFCAAHQPIAAAAIGRYLALHPGVTIVRDDGGVPDGFMPGA